MYIIEMVAKSWQSVLSVSPDNEKNKRRIRDLIKRTTWRSEVKKTVLPTASKTPRLYRHKEGVPLRPILSTTPTYCVAKHFAPKLKPSAGLSQHIVKSLSHFIKILQDVKIKDSDI